MTYRLPPSIGGDAPNGVLRDDGTFVPADPDNLDWQSYRAWCAAGRAPDPAPVAPAPAPTVPGAAVVGALSKAQAAACDVRDLVRVASNPTVPVSNPKLARMASAAGTTAGALWQAAQCD